MHHLRRRRKAQSKSFQRFAAAGTAARRISADVPRSPEIALQSIALAVCCLITGNVHAQSGAPLANVQIALQAGASHTTSDGKGAFSLSAAPGSVHLTAEAQGYAPVTVALQLARNTTVDITLEPLDAPQLRLIGRVTVDGRLAPIQGTIPSITLNRADFERLGDDRVVAALQAIPSLTFAHPGGGGSSAIAVVALRGPDPSESIVALDGQQLNDGNTGDLDLSQVPVAAFNAVDVTEGLGPEDGEGSNTFGGAINFLSLRPTKDPHSALSISAGSFGQSEAWGNATGTVGHLGYAFALDDQNESGYVNSTVPVYLTGTSGAPSPTTLGSSVGARSALANLLWTFSQRADVSFRTFVLGDNRDQSSSLNGIDGRAGSPTFGSFVGPGNISLGQIVRAYQLRGRLPLGAGELVAETSVSDDGINIDGAFGLNPYDFDHQDRRFTQALTWQRTFETSQFAIGGYTRNESLDIYTPQTVPTDPSNPSLAQSIQVLFVRGGFQPSSKVRVDMGLFSSHYTSFGSSLDGRFGATYTADPKTSVRFSIGTGFRAPLLIERYVFPATQLAQDANGVFVGQGNPGEVPERATEYELGASHEFSANSTVDVSLYRTNLRNPIEIFYPLNATAPSPGPDCTNPANTPSNPFPACFSVNSNTGAAVYEGAEIRLTQRLIPQHLFLTAGYGLNVAYPIDFNAAFSNPTSGGNLVNDAQFLGIPQQQGSLEADWANNAWHGSGVAIFRGANNELHAPPFTIFNALVGKHIGKQIDLSLAGTNLFNAEAGRYTVFGAGVPYRGVVGQDASLNPVYGELPTDALHVEPAGFRLILTVKD
jgi:outer membrane cobalamin receptor